MERDRPLNQKQRQAILERDCYSSQITGEPNCPYDNFLCSNLHVHHIIPLRVGGRSVPENLITLFSCEHVGVCPERRIFGFEKYAPKSQFVIHRDIQKAYQEYNGTKKSFEEVFRERDILVRKGKVFWDNSRDGFLREKSIKNTKKAIKKGWQWPSEK